MTIGAKVIPLVLAMVAGVVMAQRSSGESNAGVPTPCVDNCVVTATIDRSTWAEIVYCSPGGSWRCPLSQENPSPHHNLPNHEDPIQH